MNSKTKRGLILGSVFMLLFLIMLMCVLNVDVRNIGAGNTSIGCSAVNKAFRNLVGVNMTLYKITDIMGIIVILIALIPVIFGVGTITFADAATAFFFLGFVSFSVGCSFFSA